MDAAHTAGGGQVLVPAGRIYGVTDFLTVYEKTTIWAYGATIRAIGNTGILRNFLADDSFAGYEGRGSIQVLGGLWDGNAAHAGVGTVTAMTNVISWMHAADITVRDATVRNTSSAHGIELNSIDGGRVLNCRIEGFKDNSAAGNRGFSEAIQIDLARAGSGSIGLNDNTPARNILIQGCYVGPSSRLGLFGRAFGSHTLVAGTYYDGIQAVDNKIDGTMHEGIYAFGWCRSVISGNIIDNPGHAGIEIAVPDPALGYTLTPYAIAVTGNIVDAPGSESAIRAVGHPTAKLSGVRVDSNTIRSSGGNGLQIEHCVSSGVTSNTVESTASTGIFVNYSDGASVDGNTIRNAGSNAINASGSVSVAITANHIDGTAGNHGIAIGPGADGTNGQDAVITGNKIRRAASAGIRLSANATGCLVTGNQIRRDGGTTANGISLAAGATGAVVMDNDLSGNGWNAATALLVSTAAPITGMGETTALPGTNVVDTDLTPGTALEAAMRPAGRYETTSRLRCGTSSAPTSGTLNLVPIWLPQGLLISNIAFTSGGTAASLPLNCWFTLHDASRVALARTADQTTAAWAAHTTKTLAVAQTSAGTAGSCTTTYAGLHYLGVMITATAPPALVGEGSTLLGATAPGLGATNTLQTTPPNVTGGAFTAAAFTGNAILAYAYVT
ncbi:conserved hypothetical protein [Streptomyces clavuligerus]|nr:conserved hypothetical protein [Streptomyces clavuligerus]